MVLMWVVILTAARQTAAAAAATATNVNLKSRIIGIGVAAMDDYLSWQQI